MISKRCVKFNLVGGNGGLLGYAVEESSGIMFQPDCYPYQVFSASCLREIADTIESMNAAEFKEPAQQPDNTQSKQAMREIAASINAEAGFSKNENYRVPASVLERWAQQLLAL